LLNKTFNYIKINVPDVIPKPTSSRKEFSHLEKYGWYSTIIEISKTGIHGNVQQVKNTNLWDFLTTLSVLRAENKEINKNR